MRTSTRPSRLSFFLTRHLPGRDAVTYVAGQLAGATAAALLLWLIWPGKPADLGATVPTIAVGRAVIVEGVMSALLMLVILSVATDTRAAGAPAAIAIGATIALDALFGGPLTGASMNPARSFAPALVSGQWRDFWVYLAGPLDRRAARGACLPVRARRAPRARILCPARLRRLDGNCAVRLPAQCRALADERRRC